MQHLISAIFWTVFAHKTGRVVPHLAPIYLSGQRGTGVPAKRPPDKGPRKVINKENAMRTLKSLVIASAALLPFSATAFAADVIMEQPPVPAPVEIAPQYSWAGGYTGLYLGYGWNKLKNNAVGTIKPDDVKLGAYAGWNFQEDLFVYGVEGDAGYNWAKKSKNGLEVKQGFEGSLRARLGYDMNPVLPYITAGIAGAQVKLDKIGRASCR